METQTFNVLEAKAQLSKLIEKVESGIEVIIAKSGKPMARISRIEECGPKICFGVLKGKVEISEDFDAPLSEDLLSEFEGSRCDS